MTADERKAWLDDAAFSRILAILEIAAKDGKAVNVKAEFSFDKDGEMVSISIDREVVTMSWRMQ